LKAKVLAGPSSPLAEVYLLANSWASPGQPIPSPNNDINGYKGYVPVLLSNGKAVPVINFIT
jgi:hypothetical protein